MHTRASRAVAAWIDDVGTAGERHNQVALAEKLSARVGKTVSQSTVSRIVNGQLVDVPSGVLMKAFRDELGIPIDWWLPDDVMPSEAPTLPVLDADASGEHPSMGAVGVAAKHTGTDDTG